MDNIIFSHYSVMLNECIESLNINPDGIYVDCTLGGGGHSIEIVKKLQNGRLICIDKDEMAIEASKKRLNDYLDKITFVHDGFDNIEKILFDLGIESIDGAIMDLGVSSYQLDTVSRGFSYNSDAILDMRMDTSTGDVKEVKSAYTVVNNYSEQDLKKILYDYAEENFAPKIARAIVERRNVAPIETTFELVEVIKSVMPKKILVSGHHPAKQTFQAIRIEVNNELGIIEPTIKTIVNRLSTEGRLVIMTFHSLEDRIVKRTYQALAQGCTCPPSFPVCVCGNKPKIEIVNKKPILPSEKELEENNRSHSAKLRVAKKL